MAIEQSGRHRTEVNCSVIITSHNCAQYIDAAIRSVLDQLRPNDDVIVVDDYSTDETQDHLSAYESQVMSIFLDRNRGSAGARNVGAGEARNDLLVFLDGDDVALPGRLDAHRRAASTGAEISYGRIALIGPYDEFLGWHRATAQSSRVPLRRKITYENPIPFSASAITCSRFRSLGGFNESIRSSEDRELWARAIYSGAEVLFLDEYLTLYRRRPGAKSMDWRAKRTAYDAVRRYLVDELDLPPDRMAHAGYRWRRNISVSLNAWRDSRFSPSVKSIGVAIGYAMAAVPRFLEFRCLLWAEDRRHSWERHEGGN